MSTSTIAEFTINGLTYVVTLKDPPPTLPVDPDSEEMKNQIIAKTGVKKIYRITNAENADTYNEVTIKVDETTRKAKIDDDPRHGFGTELIFVDKSSGDIVKCKLTEINKRFDLEVPSGNRYSLSPFSRDVNIKYYAFYFDPLSARSGGSRRKYGKSTRARSYKLVRR